MARDGVNYLDVERAANSLAASGENPTIKRVRTFLGETGSDSTIAPLLKRWKSQHSERQTVQSGKLPPDLQVAVESLYELMQSESEEKIQQAKKSFDEQQAALDLVVSNKNEEIESLKQSNRTLEAVSSSQQHEIELLTEKQYDLRLSKAELETRLQLLSEMSEERQSEIDSLQNTIKEQQTSWQAEKSALATKHDTEKSVIVNKLHALQTKQTQLSSELEHNQHLLKEEKLAQKTTLEEKSLIQTEKQQALIAIEKLTIQRDLATNELNKYRTDNSQMNQAISHLNTEKSAMSYKLAIFEDQLKDKTTGLNNTLAELQSALSENKHLIARSATLEGQLLQYEKNKTRKKT